MDELNKIYQKNMTLCLERIRAVKDFLKVFHTSSNIFYLESAILQLRKAMELIAYASIAPNRLQYENFRRKSQCNNDYRKDFNAAKIIKNLESVNRDFYPIPLLDPIIKCDGTFHFERKEGDFLTLKNYINLYDKLGKYLHADNPWGNEKNLNDFVKTLPRKIEEIESLLALYFTTIRAGDFLGVWVVKTSLDNISVEIIAGYAETDFLINDV
ncbi:MULTISPECIES: hypothetical protein [Acinetobacter]|uniref:HEPN AbiU2-like domain-containing protein n=1 Tax=Acinetobacter chengduensis TaxID=2420890 RepID=A0ABX9TX06_9GAMM|nr:MULTISPECIES: hypothetical protein [Acinetobacter]RKG39404.1 hypothetical protein D7V31_14065 [Acinetobacter sp. WCHAc060007]RLL22596.1 hypothetical protein D9K81_07605 [Acinetobacter chengduensis]